MLCLYSNSYLMRSFLWNRTQNNLWDYKTLFCLFSPKWAKQWKKPARNCSEESLNYLKCCHGCHFFCHFLTLVLMAMKMPLHSFCFVVEQILCGWTGNTFSPFYLPFEGREAADRRSHPADWRDQRAGNDQRAGCSSAEELWEFCQDDRCKGPQVWSHGGSTSSPELASQHITFPSRWKCEYLLLPCDFLKCVCGLWSERKERTECSWVLKCFSSVSRYHIPVFKWSLL